MVPSGRRGESVGNREQVGAGSPGASDSCPSRTVFGASGQRAGTINYIGSKHEEKNSGPSADLVVPRFRQEARKRRSHPRPDRFSDTAEVYSRLESVPPFGIYKDNYFVTGSSFRAGS